MCFPSSLVNRKSATHTLIFSVLSLFQGVDRFLTAASWEETNKKNKIQLQSSTTPYATESEQNKGHHKKDNGH